MLGPLVSRTPAEMEAEIFALRQQVVALGGTPLDMAVGASSDAADDANDADLVLVSAQAIRPLLVMSMGGF